MLLKRTIIALEIRHIEINVSSSASTVWLAKTNAITLLLTSATAFSGHYGNRSFHRVSSPTTSSPMYEVISPTSNVSLPTLIGHFTDIQNTLCHVTQDQSLEIQTCSITIRTLSSLKHWEMSSSCKVFYLMKLKPQKEG